MKVSNKLVIFIMICTVIISIVFIQINNTHIISAEEAIESARIYAEKEHGGTNKSYKYEVGKAYLTADIISCLTKRRQWIIGKENIYVYIDAYSGNFVRAENYEMDSFYILPSDFEEVKKYFSWCLVLNYFIIILLFGFKNKKKYYEKVLKYLIIGLVLAVIFIDCITWILVTVLMCFFSIIQGNESAI